ncbi:conserved hypothetical protein [Flavobacterium sp. 9AF]|uniref:pirin family protein n=1 Tax=Flavobacterium sp. 9AF TaxID=2653142 RepID=UPI0012F147B7|nr:hypothetical protein [Flavobacterium sp. 9AF]VXB73865.1 conserved hypothetical protein [Flavobacterium sp. 9AF]
MIKQHPSIIIKSNMRSLDETSNFRSLTSKIDRNYNSDNQILLSDFTEETLAPKKEKLYFFENDCMLFIFPLVGAVNLKKSDESVEFIPVNQLKIIDIKKYNTFSIINPFEDELVSFIYFKLNFCSTSNSIETINLDFSISNQLTKTFENQKITVSIGKYSLRTDDNYYLENKTNSLFAFVINGAFEFQNRLLEDKDALLIWDIENAEFESLTNDALLILLELKT